MNNINFILILFLFLFVNSAGAQVTEEWLVRLNGADDSSDYGWQVFTDEPGNVYTVGHIYSAASKADYCIIKYNSSGIQQWIRTFNGEANDEDHANAALIDNDGNIYVTGGSTRPNTGMDFCTIKFDVSGNREWVVYYNAIADSSDEANFLSLDNDNNVYVSGSVKGTSSDIIVIKYNSSGEEQFVRSHNGPANGFDRSSALLPDNENNIIVSGFISGAGTSMDYCTIKYDPTGVQKWLRTYNGPSNNFDIINSMAVDDSGNIYVNGTSAGNSNVDYYTIKYDKDGAVRWGARFNSPINNSDQGSGIAVDQSGNVYSFGESIGSASGFDWLLVKYNSAGVQQWTKTYNGTANDFDDADDVVLDESGNIYAMGASTGVNSDLDFLLIKYSPSGDMLWEKRYNGPGNDFDFPAGIAIDKLNNIYLAGNSTGTSGNLDIVTIKYSQSTGIQSISENIPSEFYLDQNYPNPFNPVTKIRFQLPEHTDLSLTIFDAEGRQIETLFRGFVNAGEYEAAWDASDYPSGVYFYRIQSDNNANKGFLQTKKMVFIK